MRGSLIENGNISKAMKYTSEVGGRRMNAVVNGEMFEEVECFEYAGSKITVDRGIETVVRFRINDVGKKVVGKDK